MYPKFPQSLAPKKGVAKKSVFITFSNLNTKLDRFVTQNPLRNAVDQKMHTEAVLAAPVSIMINVNIF